MTQAELHPLLNQWTEEFNARPPGDSPGWLQQLKEQAADEFGLTGLPGRKTEAWKYTPLRVLEQRAPAAGDTGQVPFRPDSFPGPLPKADALRVHFENGALSGDLPGTPDGIRLLSLDEGFRALEPQLRQLITSVDTTGASRMFAALNTAFLGQGLVIHVGKNVEARPLLLRWAFTPEGASRMGNVRLFILLEEGAQLEIIEQFESVSETAGSLNLLTQVELSEKSSLVHTRVTSESEQALILTSTQVEQSAESSYQYSGFDLGGGLVRHELSSRLAGKGAQAGFDGAFVLDGKQHVDNHISVDHAAPDCSSKQFFRGVLGGKSRGVFNGKALIRAGADGSVVRQSNANLLLSRLAEIDTKPELEIYADEVEASHGATVGQLDEDAVFYLRTRGLTDASARHLLTAAFCHAVTDRLADRALAGHVSEIIDQAMPESLLAGEIAA